MSSTTAPEGTSAQLGTKTKAKAKRRRKHVDHFFNYNAGEFARLNGLQVRAFCGVWISLGGYRESRTLAETGFTADDCKRCLATLNRMRREAKR